MSPGVSEDFLPGGGHVTGFAVRAVGGDRVQGVGHGEDPGFPGDLPAGQAVRVACPVVPLVVVENDVPDFGNELDFPDQAVAQSGVEADFIPFLRRQGAGLVENRVGDGDFSDVVQKGAFPEIFELSVVPVAEPAGQRLGVLGHGLGMAERLDVPDVHGRHQVFEGRFVNLLQFAALLIAPGPLDLQTTQSPRSRKTALLEVFFLNLAPDGGEGAGDIVGRERSVQAAGGDHLDRGQKIGRPRSGDDREIRPGFFQTGQEPGGRFVQRADDGDQDGGLGVVQGLPGRSGQGRNGDDVGEGFQDALQASGPGGTAFKKDDFARGHG